LVATVGALYFGREIFIPLAMAVLLTFALAPPVTALRRLRIPRPLAVVSVALAGFASIIIFGILVAGQLGNLAESLPLYQRNIEVKMHAIQDGNVGKGLYDRLSRLLEQLGHQIEQPQPRAPGQPPAPAEPAAPPPLPVQVVEPDPQPLQVLQTIIGPLVQPLATGGIIVVVVIFMLLRREDLRDRFIRLVGAGDLHRTTEALQDAGQRVGQYLLMQLVVNAIYAIPIGLGLWMIGVPNPLLWGSMALVFRFVPFIGPVISAIFPLALAIAVDPGWSMLVWTIALFVVLELITGNVIEPWLYGSRTGLSPVAIIVAAIIWTWLWGPLGLLLSTPLTVCLVVLGRHVPRFEFLEVMFGDQPVLEPREQLYQRLLAGDSDEATERAEEFLDENDLIAFYQTVALPALALGQSDRERGVMSNERRRRIAESAIALVDNLEDYATEEPEPAGDPNQPRSGGRELDPISKREQQEPLPDGSGKLVVCVGGRGDLDDAAVAMLSQVLRAQGADTQALDHLDMTPKRFKSLDLTGAHCVVIAFLNNKSQMHARYMVRRVKRSSGFVRVGVVFWSETEDQVEDLKAAANIGSDFVAHDIRQAVSAALAEPQPKTSPSATHQRHKRRPRSKSAAQTR